MRYFLPILLSFTLVKAQPSVLDHSTLETYVKQFNTDDEEHFSNIKNKDAFAFLKENIPLFDCPDEDFRRTFYFRWWTYRKHIKQTPDGFVVTEFLPKVSWSGKHNTICCPAGHHFYEGRWLHNPQYLDDYSVFWLRKGGQPRSYSFWIADAYLARHMVTPNTELIVNLLDDLIKNYEAWEQSHLKDKDFLFQQIDDRDGMEVSIGGSGYRATINSYMYGDAMAISKIATMAGRKETAAQYSAKADRIKKLVQTQLWNEKTSFFSVMRPDRTLADVREQHGYTPWYVNLPDDGNGYDKAWSQLMDPKGFHAPFGPTTAEQRNDSFKISYEGHECQWNGPSWPMSTAVTLTGLANLLNNYEQNTIDKNAYFDTLKIYTKSHTRKREDGKVVPWIDENLNPFTGDWISRTRLKQWKDGTWDAGKGGKERGKDYNHSSYNDLIITGLIGLRPSANDTIVINPLLPAHTWDYFCLDNVLYKGKILTIIWDKTGKKYHQGQGLTLLINGKKSAQAPNLQKISAALDE
jgi:hypothetical protein